MKFSISDVFCEVISGLFLLVSLLPFGILLGLFSISDLMDLLKTLSAIDYALIFVILYVVGVFFDAFGLPADRILVKIGITKHTPDEESTKKFLKNATSDLFQYRWNAWLHYYCFRNILVLLPVFTVLWGLVILFNFGIKAAILFFVVCALSTLIMYFSVKQHAEFYDLITKTFD